MMFNLPYGTEEAYKADYWWSRFFKVIGFNPSTNINVKRYGDVRVRVFKHHLTVEGLNVGEPIQVVSINGFTVYQGKEHELDLVSDGIYIVKARGKAIKVHCAAY